MPNIIQAETPDQINAAREIFVEYENWLGVSLCFQGFEQELAELPGKYAPPRGALLLAFVGEKLAGCVALRPINEDVCEMKRLYVREAFRGTGLGRTLIERVIKDAGDAGYERMRLDSWIPRMQKAIGMYHALGFYEIVPCNENPYEMIFMERELG